MVDVSVPQTVLQSQALATTTEATVTTTKSFACKASEPSNDPESSKMDKPSKTKKTDERARPHLINILVCLVLVSTTLLGLVIGYEGVLRFLERKIEATKVGIPAADGRNTVELKVRKQIDILIKEPLPLNLFETHEDCLVRGARAAHGWTLPGDYTDYPDIRNQTLVWIEGSCEKMFAPQAQQPIPKLPLAIVWQHWRQGAEGLLQLMKYKLGNARGWLRSKLGKVPSTQRFPPRNATDDNATDHEIKPIKGLKPDSIYIECQTSRCHLFYLPFEHNYDLNFSIGHESLITVRRRHEDLQEIRASFKRTLLTLVLITLFMGLLETSVLLALFMNCKNQSPNPFSWNTFFETPWRRIWERLDVLEKRLIATLILSVSGGYLSLFVKCYGDNCPLVVYVGLLVLGYTGVHAFIVRFCSCGPFPLTLRQVIVDLQALNLLMLEYIRDHQALVIKDQDPIDKDIAELTPSPTRVKEPIPNVRVISPTTTFIENLEQEVSLQRASIIPDPTLALPDGHAPEGTELLSNDVCYMPAVYEDVDLHSDSDTDSSWSVV